MPPVFDQIFYPLICLIPLILLTGFSASLQSLGRLRGKELIQTSSRVPIFQWLSKTSPRRSWEATLLSLQLVKFFYYLLYAFVSFYFLFTLKSPVDSFYPSSLLEIALLLFVFLFLEFAFTLFIPKKAEGIARALFFPSSFLLIPCLPLLFLYLYIKKISSSPESSFTQKAPFRLQDKLLDYLEESELSDYLDQTEKKLMHTVVSFKDRVVREVMVPRVNLFSLDAEISIQEAAEHFSREGYSRIPVYKENVDRIIGVILYKDILSIYTKYIAEKQPMEALQKSIEQIVKPVLYTPETKKIALLLQEFRSKQIHLAIVVDEYGGTEGIVTIEDILEELVGNIQDEYDTQEEKEFLPLSSGGWIVDAKMSILDIEENLDVHIPPSAEYDTIGGYIFHRAGAIPSKGWKIHLDEVNLEVLRSDERSIQKVKITQKNGKKAK
jgi:CBS domain containing-hemolysin-like protein